MGGWENYEDVNTWTRVEVRGWRRELWDAELLAFVQASESSLRVRQ